MVDEQTAQVIEQLTLRKLQYARDLLSEAGLPHTGSREKIRERLLGAVEDDRIEIARLKALLNDLDFWGDQRIKLARFPRHLLQGVRSAGQIVEKATVAGFGEIVDGSVALVPPRELTPMIITHEVRNGYSFARIVAARTRTISEPLLDLPPLTLPEYPDVVFKPFKEETQKAVSFAEINLDTGDVLISSTLQRHGISYVTEFNEFYQSFQSFLPLGEAEPVELYGAALAIRQLPREEVHIIARRSRTRHGGSVALRSHSSKQDMRDDEELTASEEALLGGNCMHCNCYWQPVNGLNEKVHTHVFASAGEVSIFGQVTEPSVRNVLRRILSAN